MDNNGAKTVSKYIFYLIRSSKLRFSAVLTDVGRIDGLKQNPQHVSFQHWKWSPRLFIQALVFFDL